MLCSRHRDVGPLTHSTLINILWTITLMDTLQYNLSMWLPATYLCCFCSIKSLVALVLPCNWSDTGLRSNQPSVSQCHMFLGFISYSGTWQLCFCLHALLYQHIIKSVTPLSHAPVSHRPLPHPTGSVTPLFCPKLNDWLCRNGLCVWVSEGQGVCLRTGECLSAWIEGNLQNGVYRGCDPCEHGGEAEGGEQQPRGIVFLPRRRLSCWSSNQGLKVLVTPKQFNHCFDNTDSPRHSSCSRPRCCRLWPFDMIFIQSHPGSF